MYKASSQYYQEKMHDDLYWIDAIEGYDAFFYD